METIADNDFYRIEVSEAENRMYLTYRGSWIREKDVATFPDDHEQALVCLKKGFTVLVDVRPMVAMLLVDYVEKVQRRAIAAGIKKAARVYDRETFIKFQSDRINVKTSISSQAFYDMESAQAWLDE